MPMSMIPKESMQQLLITAERLQYNRLWLIGLFTQHISRRRVPIPVFRLCLGRQHLILLLMNHWVNLIIIFDSYYLYLLYCTYICIYCIYI